MKIGTKPPPLHVFGISNPANTRSNVTSQAEHRNKSWGALTLFVALTVTYEVTVSRSFYFCKPTLPLSPWVLSVSKFFGLTVTF